MKIKVIGTIYPSTIKHRSREGRVYDPNGISPTLLTPTGGGIVPLTQGEDMRIRRLTPKECFRLQGWTDDYFDRAQFVNTDSQLYKQAGNGVTVNVIQAIAEKLSLEDNKEE